MLRSAALENTQSLCQFVKLGMRYEISKRKNYCKRLYKYEVVFIFVIFEILYMCEIPVNELELNVRLDGIRADGGSRDSKLK